MPSPRQSCTCHAGPHRSLPVSSCNFTAAACNDGDREPRRIHTNARVDYAAFYNNQASGSVLLSTCALANHPAPARQKKASQSAKTRNAHNTSEILLHSPLQGCRDVDGCVCQQVQRGAGGGAGSSGGVARRVLREYHPLRFHHRH